jgi:hypothetical protein
MIHELRMYQAVPGQMAKLQARFRDQLPPIWEKHGIHAIGFWTTLVGESSNHLTYILQWEFAGRSRDEMDGVPERPGLAQGA